MLEVTDLRSGYGSIEALHGVAFSVREGEFAAIIGANGAGKSTTLRTIMGLNRASHGEVTFEGRPITNLATEQIARMGIALVPEGRRIFPGLTVLENLQVASAAARRRRTFESDLARVVQLFPPLATRMASSGWTLSGGEQQMLAIGRALVSEPRMILLDEPSLGLAPMLVTEMFNALAEIRKAGTTMLLVEQNAKQALRIADRVWVLANGTVAQSGDSEDLRSDPNVVRAYLGG